MAATVRRVIVCRHGMQRSDGTLSHEGEAQSLRLGEELQRAEQRVACIVTSTLPRASRTGWVVQRHSFPDAPVYADADLDEQRFDQHETSWSMFIRIQRVLGRALQFDGDVVLVTHSGWIHACLRALGRIPLHARFAGPVGLATAHPIDFPLDSRAGAGGWGCETPSAFATALVSEIPLRVADVPRLWSGAPSRVFGPSRLVWADPDWTVQTDVWKMEKLSLNGMHSFSAGPEMLMAISVHGGQPLSCLRALRPEHLDSLTRLDQRYPDASWVKFVLYPPWVWRLHVHICPRGVPMPFRNVHLLGDVISMVRSGVNRQGCLLVYRF